MKNDYQKLKGQNGFSLTETLVVLFIIVVVSALALMQMGPADTQFKRQNVARELKVAFERARFDSVKRHASSPVGPSSVAVYSTSYTLTTDSNNDGFPETFTSNFAPQNVTIALPGNPFVAWPVTVFFDKRGETAAVDGDGMVNPQFYVCNGGSCPQIPTAGTANLVLVTPTGTVNLLTGNATPPTFGGTSVATVPPATGINPLVRY